MNGLRILSLILTVQFTLWQPAMIQRIAAQSRTLVTAPGQNRALAADPTKPVPAVTIPFELQPYRVLISIAFADVPGLDPILRQSVLEDLPGLTDRMLGEMWSVKVESNQWLVPNSSEYLARLQEPALPESWRNEERDKSYLVCIEQSGGQFHIVGREWDHIGRILGPPRRKTVLQRREVSNAVFQLVHELFRPLISIDRVTDGTASVTAKGGTLTPADPTFAQFRQGQFWQPFLRFRNSKNEIEKLDVIPWTLLRISEISPTNSAHGMADIVTGLRSPLPARRGPRVELFARAVYPDIPATEFRLVSRRDPRRPLVGVVVEQRLKKDEPALRRLLTDRNGQVRLKASVDEPLTWLFIWSGTKKLAQLPVVPGTAALLTAELPDDSIRLRVEGELSIMESNLTDTVAQRAVLMARIRKLAASGEWKTAKDLQRELRQLPNSNAYLQELATIRLPAIQAAQAEKDRSTVASVERACDTTSKLIQKYLDEEKLKSFDAELLELEREVK